MSKINSWSTVLLFVVSLTGRLATAQSDNAVPFQLTDAIDAGGIALDRTGVMYVTDRSYNIIRKIAPTGEVSILAGFPGSAGKVDGNGREARFKKPEGVALDEAGNVYVADGDNHAIRKITAAGVVTTLIGPADERSPWSGDPTRQFYDPSGIAVDEAHNVYVTDGGVISKITSAGAVSILAVLPNKFGVLEDADKARSRLPNALAIDAKGDLYVADCRVYVIYKISSSGVVTTLAGTARKSGLADGTGSTALFYDPKGLAVGKSGNVYVADTANYLIRKITPSGVVSTLTGTPHHVGDADGPVGVARFDAPYGIAVDNDENLYVTDHGNIRKITPDGVVSTVDGLFMRGDIAGAIAFYTRAVEGLPDQSDTGKTARRRAYSSRGKLRLQQGDFSGAIADFDAALRINPQNPVYKEDLARAKAAAKRQ